jgi:hypothetical protein
MATRIDLAKRLLQRAGDDEAAAKAMLPIESVTDDHSLRTPGIRCSTPCVVPTNSPRTRALRYDADDPELVDRETALRWATSAVAWAAELLKLLRSQWHPRTRPWTEPMVPHARSRYPHP